MSINDVNERKDRPSFVRFERRPIEDKKASAEAGHYVARDVDYAMITAPYSRDVFHTKVTSWFADLQQQVATQRIPQEWYDEYKKKYEAWQNGQEMPVTGTPIRGWGVISPATQETLIRMNVLTVEDLAAMNDEGIRRVGMGANDLKNKAKGWLAQVQDKGPLTQEIAAVKARNEVLESSVTSLQKQVEQLMALVKQPKTEAVREEESDEITANDLIEDNPVAEYTKKFGKPPHHRMKPETILEALKD